MTLYRLRLLDGATSHRDVAIQANDGTTVAGFRAALASAGHATTPLLINGIDHPDQASLRDVELTNGDVLEAGVSGYAPTVRRPGWFVVAVAGPEAGRWSHLPDGGSVVVGRSAECAFTLPDSLVSGSHLGITASPDGATLTAQDLGSSNGTRLEDQPLVGATELEPGAYLQVGSTVLTVVRVGPEELPPLAPPRNGVRPFQRHFRPAQQKLPERLVPPPPPDDRNSDTGRSWWQYLLPMATGVGFALMTGRYIFLLIMAISPIALLVSHLRRQSKETKEKEQEQEQHRIAVQEHQARLAAAQAEEGRRRREAALVGGESVLVAELGLRRLWERSPDDDDFMSVCVGLATQASAISTSQDRDASRAPLWGMPLSVSLVATGSLLVQGAADRARAVARSIVLNLAATHSPRDVRISILTTEDRERDWNWARWLPHVLGDRDAARIFTSPEQRNAAMAAFSRTIETHVGDAPRSAHVVIIDGVVNVDGATLTTLLARGASAGLVGVVCDEAYTPEGVQGTLTLGDLSDEGRFSSRDHAPVTGIRTAELGVEWAERASLGMAGLQPSSADEADAGGQIHLTDIVAQGPITRERVNEFWSRSPREDVLVGLAGRTPISIDIVKHGPHAIVGGATRSGKTEFLLTWITSLCLANSPDDLAVIVADFKGGVDHEQTEKLPHVISLVTNQDIRAFERTMVMLEAELERRQQLFTSVGTSNIEAYRAKRAVDDSLLPMPRLLVVVDEFSELRQADKDGGHGYMSRLESVARVGAGLGVHLVLVTQNFSGGQLSDQIDGQVGLGVCFRVEQQEHSKVVLRSGVATAIPATLPGRAWARLRGLDLREFQSARVAGRRRDLADPTASVAVHQVPFSTVAIPVATGDVGSVPHEETDLATLIDVLNDAASDRPSPIPWPRELGPETSLASLFGSSNAAAGAPVALMDVPSEQRQAALTLGPEDEQVAVYAGSAARAAEVALIAATSEALTSPPSRLHLYGIDLEANALQPLESLPHTAAVACLNDDLAIRITLRLRNEVARRRSLFERHGVGTAREYEQRTGEVLPRVRLVVHGADRLAGSGDNDPSILQRPLSGLIAEAQSTGVGILMTGGVQLIGRRLTQRANRRLLLHFPDPSVYSLTGAPRTLGPELEGPRRLFDVEHGAVAQAGSLSTPDTTAAEVIDALGRELSELHASDEGPEPLPEVRWPLTWARVNEASIVPPAEFGAALPVGIDTDSAEWLWLDAEEDGPLLPVSGPPRSGRSTALATLAHLADRLGWDVHAVAPTKRSPLHSVLPDVAAELSGLPTASRRPTLYVVDDANRLDAADATLQKIVEESTSPVLIALAGPVDMFGRLSGILSGIPAVRASLTLAPPTSSAAGAGNDRIPDHLRAEPRAGRGVYWNVGQMFGAQIPLRPEFEEQG